ncbi:MAG TPA: GspH/FimT family pseudopilin [Caldimonas sp.]|jgi:type IV fimbrial biogenesis protein FimT|nr:GspH/FimT family pseudopilin [Caldimonas sp.]HEX2541965.1 GspH/FimT family pseudopilin [Caldimonas sp.]
MDTKHATTRRQAGLTLIELAIVVVVAAIVAAAAAPSLATFIEARRLEGAATRLAADIHFVRSDALARNRPLRLSFQAHAGATCWIAHTGAATQCTCAAPGPAVCTGGAMEIKTVRLAAADGIALAANVASIAFDPLHGTSTPTGTLRLVAPSGRAIHHVVNVMGRARSCSPAGRVAGYRPC